jgi:hypothetical protein
MAGFKTHITVSTLFGVGYGVGAYMGYEVPWQSCLLAGGLCSVSGMLPDVDSDSGVPLRESLSFAAAVISMMMIHRFRQLGLSPEMLVLAGAGTYLAVRFGFGEFLRRYTVHRGMFHSLPAALIAGELAFLLASGETPIRYYKAGAVVLGYVSHLVLDELYSFKMKRGRLQIKKSFGTALKLVGHGWWPNVSVYAKLALLSWLVLTEPGWMAKHAQPSGGQQEVAQRPTEMTLFGWRIPLGQEPSQSDATQVR